MTPFEKALTVIGTERVRQVRDEGRTPDHDTRVNPHGELAMAAACYAAGDITLRGNRATRAVWAVWPWEREWWKPRSRWQNLVRAGALIVAELERLERAGEGE